MKAMIIVYLILFTPIFFLGCLRLVMGGGHGKKKIH